MEDLHIDPITQLEAYCNLLDSKSVNSVDVKRMNEYLTQFMTYGNYESLKLILSTSESAKAKFYAANSLFNIMTSNYLTIEITDREGLYDFLLNFIVNIFI